MKTDFVRACTQTEHNPLQRPCRWTVKMNNTHRKIDFFSFLSIFLKFENPLCASLHTNGATTTKQHPWAVTVLLRENDQPCKKVILLLQVKRQGGGSTLPSIIIYQSLRILGRSASIPRRVLSVRAPSPNSWWDFKS